MKGKILFAHLAALLSNIILGVNFIFAKVLLPDYMSANDLAFLKISVGAIFLVAIALFMKGWRIDKEDIPRFAMIGVFGIACSQILFYEGVALSSPIDASIITSFSPVMVIVISALFYSEKISSLEVFGTVLCVSGAMLAIVGGGTAVQNPENEILGKVYLLIGTLFTALYVIWSKPLMLKYNSMVVVGWLFAFAAIVTAVYVGKDATAIVFSAITPKAYVALGFIVIGATIGSFALRAYSLKYIEPVTSSMYTYIKPVVATIAAIILGQDDVTVTRMLAIVLVISGIWVVDFRLTQRKKPRVHDLGNGT